MKEILIEAAHEAENAPVPTRLVLTSAGVHVQVTYALPGEPIVRWEHMISWPEIEGSSLNFLVEVIHEGCNKMLAHVHYAPPTKQ